MKVGHCKAPVRAVEHEGKKINEEMNEDRKKIPATSYPAVWEDTQGQEVTQYTDNGLVFCNLETPLK